jgi:DNA-binding MarR family transcriptional regulator
LKKMQRIDDQIEKLRQYVAEHGAIPSVAGLAALWGYASKSAAAKVVSKLIEAGVLARAPGGRLRQGAKFAVAASEPIDDLDRAASQWKDQWRPTALAESYDLIARITRLARVIDESARKVAAQNGLTVGELLVLDVLMRLGPPHRCAPTALKRHFVLTLAGVGKRVDSLHGKGLIDRVPSECDGRSLLVALTDKGKNLLERAANSDMAAPHIAWAMGMGSTERARLMDILRHAQHEIERGMSAERAPAASGAGARESAQEEGKLDR